MYLLYTIEVHETIEKKRSSWELLIQKKERAQKGSPIKGRKRKLYFIRLDIDFLFLSLRHSRSVLANPPNDSSSETSDVGSSRHETWKSMVPAPRKSQNDGSREIRGGNKKNCNEMKVYIHHVSFDEAWISMLTKVSKHTLSFMIIIMLMERIVCMYRDVQFSQSARRVLRRFVFSRSKCDDVANC